MNADASTSSKDLEEYLKGWVPVPGPVFAVTVAKGYRNKIAGTLIALGHGIIEFPLMFLIYFGYTWFFASSTAQRIMSFIGGLILIYMSIQTFRLKRRQARIMRVLGIAPLLLVFLQPAQIPTSLYGGLQSAPP